MRNSHIVIRGLPGSNIFRITSQMTRSKKKKVIEHEMCSDFLYKFCLKNFSFYEEMSDKWSKIYFGLHVKYKLFLSYLNGSSSFSTDFRKVLNIRFQVNPSSGSRVVPWGRTDGRRDMTKLIAAFRNSANALNFPLQWRTLQNCTL